MTPSPLQPPPSRRDPFPALTDRPSGVFHDRSLAGFSFAVSAALVLTAVFVMKGGSLFGIAIGVGLLVLNLLLARKAFLMWKRGEREALLRTLPDSIRMDHSYGSSVRAERARVTAYSVRHSPAPDSFFLQVFNRNATRSRLVFHDESGNELIAIPATYREAYRKLLVWARKNVPRANFRLGVSGQPMEESAASRPGELRSSLLLIGAFVIVLIVIGARSLGGGHAPSVATALQFCLFTAGLAAFVLWTGIFRTKKLRLTESEIQLTGRGSVKRLAIAEIRAYDLYKFRDKGDIREFLVFFGTAEGARLDIELGRYPRLGTHLLAWAQEKCPQKRD